MEYNGVMAWLVPPGQDSSHHQYYYIFRFGDSEKTFIRHWNPGRGGQPKW